MWNDLLYRLRALVRRGADERNLDDELQLHIQLETDKHVKAGLALDEAARRARLNLGGIADVRERCREARGLSLLETPAQDLRYAVRTLLKSPDYLGPSVAVLALAVGASTAMFSVVNAVLLQPLPYPSPHQLTMLWTGTPDQDLQGRPDYRTVDAWRRQNQSFADMAVLDPVSVTMADTDGVEKVSVARISPNFFPLLGVEPLEGRGFSTQEADERQRLALLSHRFWQSRFGGSPDVIGRSIVLDGLPSRIIGILPAAFEVPFYADVWEPHTIFSDWETRRSTPNAGSWFVVGRLRPNVTVDQAQAEMSAIARILDQGLPAAERNRSVHVLPLSVYVVGTRSRLALWLLSGAVFCVLLVAMANAAGLSLARAAGRNREMAVRAALGASRARIVRQLVAESMTLAAMSGLLGTLLAVAGVDMIRAFGPGSLARLNEVSLDPRALGWVLAISLMTGLVVGLAPALTISRVNLPLAGTEGGRTVSSGPATRGIRRALVVGELAVAIVLLVGAGLLVRSWVSVSQVDPGFTPERVLSMNMTTTAVVAAAERVAFYADVVEQVQSLPGIENAGIIGDLFVSGDTELTVTAEGSGEGPSERLRLRIDEVSGGLFTTLRTPLFRGRFFSAADGPDSPRVAIVNQTMARRLWPGRDPVGRRFKFGPPDADRSWISVVGIVGDMRRQGIETAPISQVFLPLAQQPSGNAILLVRTATDDPLEMAEAVQAAVRRVEKDVPLSSVTTLEERLGAGLVERRVQTALLAGFSVVALLMAATGIYGLVQYAVTTRTREIAIRVAVGARAGEIFHMIITEGLKLSLAGLVLGLLGALWLGRVGSNLLFGVSATDPVTLLTVSVLLAAVAAAACYLPARRAMKIEPIVALRQD